MIALLTSLALGADPGTVTREEAPADDAAAISVSVGDGAVLELGGYLDVGWFDAQAKGAAYDRLPGTGPAAAGTAWKFYGDPWANPVNSLGESADLGLETLTTLDRDDPIDSDGNPSFLVNQWHQEVDVALEDRRVVLRGALDFAPRPGQLGDLGDRIWVDTAYLEWLPSRRSDLRITAGKVESAFGWEYRYRQAPDRDGITPSLLARYTTGTPVGVKARGSIRKVFWLAGALTNGNTFTERFGHFAEDTARNPAPTATGRASVLARGTAMLEIGVSGQVGSQGADAVGTMFGADLTASLDPVVLKAEIVRARNPRASLAQDQLEADAWMIELSALPIRQLRPIVRVDRRDARLITGPNLYRSDVLRTTAGLRVNASTKVALKAEYLHLVELLGPPLPNDVITTSAVARF